MPAALAAAAAGQWGVFTVAQALRSGLSRDDLARLVADRHLRRQHDVFVVAGSPDEPLQRLWVAYLSVGEPCAFAGLTAGWLLGLPGCADLGRPELVVPSARRPRATTAAVRRVSWWAAAKVELDAGLPRLGAVETVVTLAPLLPRRALHAAVQQAVFDHRLRVEDIREQLRRGLPGSARLAQVLARYDRGHDSSPEAEVYRVLRRAGFPPDHCNVSVRTAGGRLVGPFDGYYEVGVAYEYDGLAEHDSTSASERDETKSTEAGEIAVRVVRLTNTDRRDPERLVRRIRAAVVPAPFRADLTVVHRGRRACVCGWAPGTAR